MTIKETLQAIKATGARVQWCAPLRGFNVTTARGVFYVGATAESLGAALAQIASGNQFPTLHGAA